jgi:glycosyltransferase involved in cell wall biosynthesis
MKIAQVIGSWVKLGPTISYSIYTIQGMCYLLTEELVKRGHEVTLFAPRQSQSSAKIGSSFAELKSHPLVLDQEFRVAYRLSFYKEAAWAAQDFDIIHNHKREFLFFADFIKTPVVTTMHFSGDSESDRLIFSHNKKAGLIAISHAQTRNLIDFPFLEVVYNGVRLTDFKFGDKPEDYFLFLGRINPIKGTYEAVLTCKKANKPLVIAGEASPRNQDYAQQVSELARTAKVKMLGVVSHPKKVPLLGNARALLFPINWEEPFGLVMIEAMACGTPVIAFNRGSVPEIVVDGKTGFIVNTVEEMVEAIQKVDQIDRRACRAHVEKNFTLEKMVDNYERVYPKVLSSKKV